MGIPAVCQAYIDSDAFRFVDNGRAPRWKTDFNYNTKKGLVNHIPVCHTLKQLTDYFNGGGAEGSTQFGLGRARWGLLEFDGFLIPIAEAHQYMPIKRNATYPNGCAPWAQGIIAKNANCNIPPTPSIAGMGAGVPNGAFYSIENVAMRGSDGVTDEQFNSNVLLRAYLAGLDGFPINPLTQLWHSEIDQANRCDDPGWSGALENQMQDAANKLLLGNLSGLRNVTRKEAPKPKPVPVQPKAYVGNPPKTDTSVRLEPLGRNNVTGLWEYKTITTTVVESIIGVEYPLD